MNKCVMCGGTVNYCKVDVERKWQNRLVIIEGVPANVCEQCGEQYFDSDVVLQMEQIKKAINFPGERFVKVPVRRFENKAANR